MATNKPRITDKQIAAANKYAQRVLSGPHTKADEVALGTLGYKPPKPRAK